MSPGITAIRSSRLEQRRSARSSVVSVRMTNTRLRAVQSLLSIFSMDWQSICSRWGWEAPADHTLWGCVINQIIYRVWNYRFVFRAVSGIWGIFVVWSLSAANWRPALGTTPFVNVGFFGLFFFFFSVRQSHPQRDTTVILGGRGLKNGWRVYLVALP